MPLCFNSNNFNVLSTGDCRVEKGSNENEMWDCLELFYVLLSPSILLQTLHALEDDFLLMNRSTKRK